ncbi:hypothetical protein C8Q75DRAFT_811541 [Abortiporus biennis]|nr:hypothetical protein C8Q75DRAFT_811541 [Abortiporus biennis]
MARTAASVRKAAVKAQQKAARTAKAAEKANTVKRVIRVKNAAATKKKEQRVTCPDCGRSIARKSDLPRHQQTHLPREEWKHRCPIPGCTFANPQKCNLDQHLNTHSEECKYHCERCNLHFRTACQLCRHNQKYHPQAGPKTNKQMGGRKPGKKTTADRKLKKKAQAIRGSGRRSMAPPPSTPGLTGSGSEPSVTSSSIYHTMPPALPSEQCLFKYSIEDEEAASALLAMSHLTLNQNWLPLGTIRSR